MPLSHLGDRADVGFASIEKPSSTRGVVAFLSGSKGVAEFACANDYDYDSDLRDV